MEDLTNIINNLEIKEQFESFSINGRMEYFRIDGNNVYRFSYSQDKWIYFDLAINFPVYKKSIIIDLADVKIKSKYEKRRLNKNVLERSKDGKVWRNICIFNNNGQCYNYSIASCGFFCKSHKDGIINEKINETAKGDIIEDWVYNLLCKSNQLINVENKGQENGKLDIVFQVKDEVKQDIIRGIQVKQLTKYGENGYYITHLKKYDENTLIVGVSEDKKYMCLFFNSFINGLDSFCFNISDYKYKKYKKYIFTGLEDDSLGYNFFNKLIEYCKISTIYDDNQFSENILKENKMMKELEEKCKENNLSFESCNTSDSPIDVYINEKKVQCKYSSQIINNLYDFKLKHIIDNIADQPYSKNDVDLFIFKHEKEESFYIIPQKVLLHFDYLTTEKIKGKIRINLAPSLYKEYHWTKQFINRFDLINNEYDLRKIINLNNPFDKFQHLCKSKKIICIRNMTNLSLNNGFIGDKTFKLMISNNPNGSLYRFCTCIHNGKNRISYHINNDNIPDFFIFRIEKFPEDFYIIPKDILVEQEIIGSEDKKGKIYFGLPEPTDKDNEKQWVFDYLNNFDLLKDKIELLEEI